MFPPAASSSLPLPICYRSPPAIPSLGDCFPCGSIDLGKYVLYSSALRQRARWHTSLALSFGGHGTTLPFADNSVNADERREPKTRTQRFVYARRDTEDGPLEIIPPEESTRSPPPSLSSRIVATLRHHHPQPCRLLIVVLCQNYRHGRRASPADTAEIAPSQLRSRLPRPLIWLYSASKECLDRAARPYRPIRHRKWLDN